MVEERLQKIMFNSRDGKVRIECLTNVSKVTKAEADQKALAEYENYALQRRQLKEAEGERNNFNALLEWQNRRSNKEQS